MCFALQRSAISRPENFKKCSEPNMLCTCSLANALRATVACNFWFLCGPLASAPAALTGLLFDWHDTRIIEKTQHFATSLTFGADVSSFYWLDYSTTVLFICFSTLHIVGSFYLNFLRPILIPLFHFTGRRWNFLRFSEPFNHIFALQSKPEDPDTWQMCKVRSWRSQLAMKTWFFVTPEDQSKDLTCFMMLILTVACDNSYKNWGGFHSLCTANSQGFDHCSIAGNWCKLPVNFSLESS